MSSDIPVSTKEPLLQLRLFSEALRQGIEYQGFSPEETFAVLHSSVSAQCVGCGIHVSGEELFALSQPSPELMTSPKIARMRLGDCARKGCDCFYYEFTFQPYPRIDWPMLLKCVKAIEQDKARDAAKSSKRPRAFKMHWNAAAAGRLGIAAALLMILLVMRQFYYGGRIPLLREPERFRITQSNMEQVNDYGED